MRALSKIRLFTTFSLSPFVNITITQQQHHYLSNVMRVRLGSKVRLFNGQDGEWVAEVIAIDKRSTTLVVQEQSCLQQLEPGPILAFAPTKNEAAAFVVQKATELGASAILPVLTERTVVNKINIPKLELVAIEAAEQCGRLTLPVLHPPIKLAQVVGWCQRNKVAGLIVGNPHNGMAPSELAQKLNLGQHMLLVGPEGGLSEEEIILLEQEEFTYCALFGTRVLRADTAAVAALAVYQTLMGDWRN